MQWSADVTEHAHVTEIKNPACTGNNQNYYAQIACHLDHSQRCFNFDLATQISHADDSDSDNNDNQDHKLNEEGSHSLLSYSPTHKVIDYFEVAHTITHSPLPDPPKLLCMFASGTTAIHLATKLVLQMTIDEAVMLYELPDLHLAILDYLDHCARGIDHDITG
ncbi:hypothetical protein PISMIDRAFT_115727 [Pisolithus microcarpus 441]|uniref:DUF6830 domain-containing protein n=1 Tax=Pisolithus microcarpus 441 TaxID=765257 RepID=A0A0C9Z545_9AGAM|nr:hypothetical protein PISMIDRAFT_115727 [Pisolithus microcarpus 441]